MIRKFLILGVVLMALFGLIVVKRLALGLTLARIIGMTIKTGSLKKSIGGQWRSVDSFPDNKYGKIIFYENYFIHYESNVGKTVICDEDGSFSERHSVLYTEGADLYKRGSSEFQSDLIGRFTSDTTFEKAEIFSTLDVNYYKIKVAVPKTEVLEQPQM
jgi:hypothetical protein